MGSRQVSFFKRRFTRARMGATALVMRRLDGAAEPLTIEDEGVECLGPLVVENVSAGGALLLGGAGFRVGQAVELELQLRRGLLIRTRAVIVRIEPHLRPMGVAVQFLDLSREAEEAIQQAVWEAIERTRAGGRKVIAVTPLEHDSRQLGLSIASLGMEPLLVTTLLDALRWLQDPRVVVSALMIDARAEGGTGLDALTWCADAFPGVRRVLIAHTDEKQNHARDPRRRAADAIVQGPIELRRLARALGVHAPHQTETKRPASPWTETGPSSALRRPPALSTIPVPGW